MKLKSFCKFLVFSTLFVQFFIVPKTSHADTFETAQIHEGTYKIVSALNDSSLLDMDMQTRNVQLFTDHGAKNQKWKFTYIFRDGAYSISCSDYSKGSSYLGSDGYNVYGGTGGGHWELESAGDGYYYLRNNKDYKYLDVYDEKTEDKTNIIVYNFNGQKNQKFKLVRVD
ncbi:MULTISPECIES: RICIN domain-containing protein [Bacillus]|uniref:RICIN domain-containing protein n=1 Tax=Bacillus TaxID=1386 RepID=UPI00119C92A5|nr:MULTISPECIES: RICIN domain-containing protein [Bacillus]